MSTRATRSDWLSAGLALLRDGGAEALTIDNLCVAVGRSKGSFYHHFQDIAAYHKALLSLWAELHTELPIEAANSGDSAERRKRLYRSVGKLDLGLERAVHAWAVRSLIAKQIVGRVHARRITFLTALRDGEKDADEQAELEYSAFIGSIHVFPDEWPARLRVLTRAASLPDRQTAHERRSLGSKGKSPRRTPPV